MLSFTMLLPRFLTSGMFCFVSSGSCPPSPSTLVIKKPGGSETVFDMGGDFETVSVIDEEKYASIMTCSLCCH